MVYDTLLIQTDDGIVSDGLVSILVDLDSPIELDIATSQVQIEVNQPLSAVQLFPLGEA